MKKLLLCIIFILLFPSISYATDEVAILFVDVKNCESSRFMAQLFKNNALKTTQKQTVYIYNGEEYKEYLVKHNIRWYPTLLKYERGQNNKWVERERVVGSKSLNFVLDFLGRKGIIKEQERQRQPQMIVQNQGGS